MPATARRRVWAVLMSAVMQDPRFEFMIEMAAGPMTAMKRQGRMQKISGTVIFTGTCCAFCSARWRRRTRISCDWVRSTEATGMPKASAWAIAPTKVRTSTTLVRSLMARSASPRPLPSCISCSIRLSSSESGPSVLRATCWIAASKPSPDSTQIVSRSIASGSSRCISSVRSCASW